jgi:hypothetical protein
MSKWHKFKIFTRDSQLESMGVTGVISESKLWMDLSTVSRFFDAGSANGYDVINVVDYNGDEFEVLESFSNMEKLMAEYINE